MSLPQVGLQAVIAGLPGFNAGAVAITKAYDEIEKKGANVAKASNILGSSISSVAGPFVNLGQSVLNFGAIAGGTALIGIGALTAGIAGLGVLAVGEFAKYERMSLSITNLVAREISQGQVQEQQIQSRISLTRQENEELSQLPQKIQDEELSRKTLAAQIQEQKQRIIELTASYGENGLNVQTAKARLAEMENEYSKSGSAIDTLNGRMSELNNKNGQLTTVLQKVRVGQMSMTDAMAQAGPKAQELLKWIQLLAIQSPFSQEDVALSFQTAMAYGFTTKQAKRLTIASLDFAAATGKGGEVTGQIALALGQMQAKGKVSGQELIQLTNAGVGVNKILEDMGFTLDDVSKGLVSSDAFINAVMKDMEVFKGTGKAQSSTFAGLFASLSDLKSIGLREFFGGTFKAIQPYLAQFVDFLTKAVFETGSIKALGDTLGTYVGEGLKTVLDLVAQFQRWGPEGIFAAMGFKSSSLFIAQLSALWAMITEQGPSAESVFTSIGVAVNYLQANTFPMLTKAISFVMQNFDSFKGALLGIGAVLGAGVFAAIVAGILSLVTPISLIVAGAALLGAAWMGNWGGIQEKTFAVWAVVQPILQQIYNWLSVNIPIAVQMVTAAWNNILYPALVLVANWLSGVWFPLQVQWYTFLGTTLVTAITTLSAIWTGTLLPALTSVGNYISTNLVPLTQSINNFIIAVFNKTIQATAGLWQNILYPALRDVFNIISSSLQPILSSLSGTISEDVSPLLDNLGAKILPTLSEGLKMVTRWIKEATGFFNTLANAVKNFQLPDVLKPGSPPPFAIALSDIATSADQASMGIEKFQRLLTGVNTSSGEFAKTAAKIMQASIDFTKSLQMGGVGNIAQQARNVFTGFTAQIIRSGEAGQLTAASLQTKLIKYLNTYNKNVPATLNYFQQQGLTFEYLAEQLNKSFGDFMKSLRLQAITEDLGLAGRFASFGQTVTDRLNSDIETLQKVANGEAQYYHNELLTTVQAQELLNQKLADQVSVQKEINQLAQQQADLQFLQQQVDIIKLVQDRGLDMADVFGDIKFGLDASLPDLIKATSNVVQAMIDQINTDLQAGSPSKIMVNIGKMIDSSIGKGLIDNVSAPLSAARKMVEGVVSVASGQLAGAGQSVSNVVNNNFNMDVSTLASPQAVMQQYQVMRAMV